MFIYEISRIQTPPCLQEWEQTNTLGERLEKFLDSGKMGTKFKSCRSRPGPRQKFCKELTNTTKRTLRRDIKHMSILTPSFPWSVVCPFCQFPFSGPFKDGPPTVK